MYLLTYLFGLLVFDLFIYLCIYSCLFVFIYLFIYGSLGFIKVRTLSKMVIVGIDGSVFMTGLKYTSLGLSFLYDAS